MDIDISAVTDRNLLRHREIPAGLRVMAVPNGTDPVPQQGYVNEFEHLQQAGLLEHFSYCSIQQSIANGLKAKDAWKGLEEQVGNIKPDVLIVFHLKNHGLDSSRASSLRRAAGNGLIVYYDPDAFGRNKGIEQDGKSLIPYADLCIGCGTSSFPNEFDRAGARAFSYAPNSYDQTRFGGTCWKEHTSYDVVAIMNRNDSRLPWRRLPGWRGRTELVELLSKRFGSRFAIYGRGWKGISAKGPIPYSEQTEILEDCQVTANWDYFPEEANYFSDRLPIMLSGGRAHVTSDHPGYATLFDGVQGLYPEPTPSAVVRRVEKLLAMPEQLARDSIETHRFASSNMSQSLSARALLARSAWKLR